MKERLDNTSGKYLAHTGNNRKLILAVSLLAVMATMWIRVLFGGAKTVSNADAVALDDRGMQSEEKQDCLILKYHSLPFVMGRDDILARDLFSRKPWKEKGGSHNGEPVVCNDDIVSGPELIKGLSDVLESRLKAVMSGREKEAFIGDKLCRIGDVLRIDYKGKYYRLKIVVIKDESVIFKDCETNIRIEVKVER